ncbi:MAG: cation:proton antiporter [Negativicutes bacterium]|jgi:CPA2 family monovalent cation:H+ antiporter-2|nr:cation:proton antiporter [Negativicutes bacterium]
MHDYQLLEILAIGFALALLFGYLAQRIGLSPIVGYLLAGFLAGPQSPGFVADPAWANQLSEVGVILLMFGVGLHFDLSELASARKTIVPTMLLKAGIMLAVGIGIASQVGFTFAEGVILGVGLSVASTVVAMRVFSENNLKGTVPEQLTVASLVVEDILMVLCLVLLPNLAGVLKGTEPLEFYPLLLIFGTALLKLALLGGGVIIIGGRLVPWFLKKIARTHSQELFTLTILVVAFITAVGGSYFFNASFALGAFLGGMVVGKSETSHQAGANLLPLRDAFSVLFFLSVGMLFQPDFLFTEFQTVIITILAILLIKPLISLICLLGFGYSVHAALLVGIGLGQIGEFSFILSQMAMSLGLISPDISGLFIVSAMGTITLNPLLFKAIPKIEAFLKSKPALWKFLSSPSEKKLKAKRPQNEIDLSKLEKPITAIVVGFGPTGKQITRILRRKGITPIIVDMNVDTVEDLDAIGIATIYGDASKSEVLLAAGLGTAQYIIITVPNAVATTAVAITAKALNPEVRVFARIRFLKDGEILDQMGIEGLAVEEREVATTLAQKLLVDLEHQQYLIRQAALKE